MSVHETLTLASELGFTPLNLVLVAMLYFLGANHGFFPKWWGDKGEQPATKKQMEYLTNYYNHDTTEILHSINSNVEKVHSAIHNLNSAFDKLEKSVDSLTDTQKEWEKFGVPVRDKK